MNFFGFKLTKYVTAGFLRSAFATLRGFLWFFVHENMGCRVFLFSSSDVGEVGGWGSDAMTSEKCKLGKS